MRSNLLVVAAGDSSLHQEWIGRDRSFDVFVIYYGADALRLAEYQTTSDRCFTAQGLKVALARKILLENLHFKQRFNFEDYNYIWFPDDDLRFPRGVDIEDIFATARALKADVFQAAIQNEDRDPPWAATKQIPDAFCHRTNIVELMAHGFSGTAFTYAYLPAIHAMEFMNSGWGLEPIWMKIGETNFRRPLRTFVLDCCPVIHTRPIGTGAGVVHSQGRWEAQFVPQIETNRMRTLQVFSSLEQAVSMQDESDVAGWPLVSPQGPDVPTVKPNSVSKRMLRLSSNTLKQWLK
jgi:hypothetical protein